MSAYKNRHIPDDGCIRKNKKIVADADCTYLIVILTFILSTFENSL